VRELTSSIDIDASPAVVWAVLTDFPAYPEWNPVEISVKGEPVTGTIIEHTSQIPGSKPMTFRPTVVAATPEKELAWRGKLFVRGLFDVVHRFWLESLDGGRRTRFHQDEQFRGVMIPFSGSTLRRTHEAFHTANDALKVRVELQPR
jgi:hypothetical protein